MAGKWSFFSLSTQLWQWAPWGMFTLPLCIGSPGFPASPPSAGGDGSLRGHSEEPNLPYRSDQGESNDGRQRAGLPRGSCVLLGHLGGALGCEPRPGLRPDWFPSAALTISPVQLVAQKSDAASDGGQKKCERLSLSVKIHRETCKPIRGTARG